MDLIIDTTMYVAPRTTDAPCADRTVMRAECGHDVWLSPRGVRQVQVNGKHLYCEPCIAAWAGEHGRVSMPTPFDQAFGTD